MQARLRRLPVILATFWTGVVTGWFLGAGSSLQRGYHRYPSESYGLDHLPRGDKITFRRKDGEVDYVSLNGD